MSSLQFQPYALDHGVEFYEMYTNFKKAFEIGSTGGVRYL